MENIKELEKTETEESIKSERFLNITQAKISYIIKKMENKFKKIF